MSKSILIVICDFLVLSLISLVNFEDMPSATQEDKQKEEAIVVKSFADAQMVDLLKMSLDSEREKREALKSDVEKLSQAAKESLEQSDKQQKIIAAREKQLEEMRLTKESVESVKSLPFCKRAKNLKNASRRARQETPPCKGKFSARAKSSKNPPKRGLICKRSSETCAKPTSLRE